MPINRVDKCVSYISLLLHSDSTSLYSPGFVLWLITFQLRISLSKISLQSMLSEVKLYHSLHTLDILHN